MMIVRACPLSFARLDGGLPNDLAGSANDMAIWLAARSIRARSASYHTAVRHDGGDLRPIVLQPPWAASAEAPEDAIVTYGFGELFPIHVREVQIVLDGPQLGDDDAERWPAMEEIHHQHRVIRRGQGRAVSNE